MKLKAVATLVLVGAGGIAIVAATGVWALSGGLYGCTRADEELAPTLASLSILDAHPSQTQPQGERYSGCDEDDGFAYAGQYFRLTTSRVSVLTFYRKAATEDGWRLQNASSSPSPAPGSLAVDTSALCFEKPIAGTTAHLAVWFPSDLGDSPDDFGLEVTASRDGTAWC
ncbi:hypothetical protein SSP24_48380 [Streptomyces spinoverrucosus]|uniref:Lipoprotein n=1 Tax=Streptomyces spinoverrucosus TaxID=284043 RepID=A0A4Y3VKW8_9ACTN|nr:hypothetical protein [Streptomyces spinoverrucosus]GEC07183.1 hypothetical protein SSP24_48380 [Streptomyces spinoverrucosus]GHB80908.1 hypothetical protein GCM10010397_59650 [Streptomyces spinoverrucosus]